MNITCIPTRQLFFDYTSNYRVLSCSPINPPTDFTLNKYNNFTISGSNISYLTIGEECELTIRPDKRSKYPASYILVGYPSIQTSIQTGEEVKVDPDKEYSLLCNLMERSQATYVHQAYPHFIEMTLNGRESEIDYKNIYNVGAIRLESYIDKVKSNFHSILYYPVANEWGIDDFSKVEQLAEIFATPDELKEAFDANPYHVFGDLLSYPFAKTDKIVLNKRPDLIDSLERCEHGCLEILRQNETAGDTRINKDLMAEMARDLIPEAMNHIVEATTQSKLIHYDPETEYTSIETTYQAELTIAENIKERLNNPVDDNMDWEKFKKVDGFKCTDEQGKILELASSNSIAMLVGSAGTGKTTSMKALILMLEEYQKDYLLLAPTGIAAKRLRESTGRPASTIHMFLASAEMASPDYVLIDECSMVAVELLANLFNAIPKRTKFIFICDNAQLASISCGNIVQDIIDSHTVPIAELTKVFRYGTSGLATVATDTRNGIMTDVNVKYDDYSFESVGANPIKQVVDKYEQFMNEGYSKDDIMVLCPFNKSQIGSYKINNAIQKRFNTHVPSDVEYEVDGNVINFRTGDKVINTHNNYHMPVVEYDEDGNMVETRQQMFVANGDIGTIRHIKKDDKEAVIIAEFDNGLARISGADIKDLLLGYCVSIHRVQGSEHKAVILITDKCHKSLLSRNLYYVGRSRSKERLIEIGDIDVIKDALEIQENQIRDTNLRDMLMAEE